ncbi:hypothetical protein [Marinifilum sp. D737]|uniref:hypothetical protein n=1 Tax=Marinifilum sp. D737 TaxID=2969628 RepID=UPI002276007F|nr:hypothetical protein [Marinifilum sp. D737]MCY1635760.1 hypothetical protein [Marinifilum sp. D737]
MKKALLLISIIFVSISVKSQSAETLYDSTLTVLEGMIEDRTPIDFKNAVYMVENSFYEGKLSYKKFCEAINYYKHLCEGLINARDLKYNESDKEEVSVYAAVFSVMKDTIPIEVEKGKIIYNLPLTYDFEDITGEKDWTKMFVSKLLTTYKGNCHSLPYLYKILVEELGGNAYLAYAPNHIYIKQHSKAFGWYNTELTSGMFPIDSWLMASGYIHLSAIQKGIYMDTLNAKQSIGTCMLDLAMGYQKKFGTKDGSFILKVCNRVLKYHPNNINALLFKAETKMNLWKQDNGKTKEQKQKEFEEIQKLYVQIHQLGYRKMPTEMYLNWLVSLKEEKHKYQNQKINLKIK